MRSVRGLLAFAGVVVLTATTAGGALATVGEFGTKNCGSLTGKVRGRYNDVATLTGPGSTNGHTYTPNDGLWHTQERWGEDGGGDWGVTSNPFLNGDQTYAFCVSA